MSRASPPTDQRRWLMSFLGLATGEAGSSMLRLAAIVWIARGLGPDRFGLFTVGTAVAGYLSIFGQAGLDIVATRDVAAHPDRALDYLGRITTLRILTAAAAYVAFALASLALPLDRVAQGVLLLLGLIAISQAFDVRWAFVARHQTKWVAIATFAGGLVFLGGAALFVHTPGDLYAMVAVTLVADLVIEATLITVSRLRFGRWRLRSPAGSVRTLLGRGVPVMVTRGARTMIITLDVVFVRLLRPSAESGQYAIASRIIAVGVTYIGLYYHTYLPGLARGRLEPERLVALVRGARRRVWQVGPPVLAVLLVTVGLGTRLVFGHAYDASIGLTQVMLPSLLLLGFTGVWSGVLLAYDRQRTLAVAAVVATAINVVANFVLLPTIGAVGASIATVLAEAVQLGLTWFAARALLREVGVDLDAR